MWLIVGDNFAVVSQCQIVEISLFVIVVFGFALWELCALFSDRCAAGHSLVINISNFIFYLFQIIIIYK
jgi:hypothetical protein